MAIWSNFGWSGTPGDPITQTNGLSKSSVVSFVASVLFTATGLFVGSAATNTFEVASIRISGPGHGGMAVRELKNGRMRIENAPLRQLILYAFDVESYRLIGGPAWISNAAFDITAKANSPATEQEMWRLLQGVLQERFQLKVHRESRDLKVYDLSMIKGRTHLSKPGPCLAGDPRGTLPRPAPGQPLLARCGNLLIPRLPNGGIGVRGGSVTITRLISTLSWLLGRPVLDKTGFSQPFDVNLEFAIDDSLEGFPHPPVESSSEHTGAAADPSGLPSIVTALREKLGLQLATAKAPVEVIVIDSVRMPTPN